MIDLQFIQTLQHLSGQGKDGLAEMRRVIAENGGVQRLIDLAALTVVPATKTKRAKQPSIPGLEFPDWWPTAEWSEFVSMRRATKTPLTDYAIKLLVSEMTKLRAAGNDPAAVLAQSIVRCYTDIYAVKTKNSMPPEGVVFEQTSIPGWLSRLEGFYEDGSWTPKWGGKPPALPTDSLPSDCRCPAQAFALYIELRKRRA